nr:bHLH35 [Fraxinus mandshurica]
MENNSDESPHYWLTMLLQSEEPDCYLNEAISAFNGSSSDPGTVLSSMATKKSIDSEKNRRNKLKERLHALRSAVPKITKMDKESIIKDAIDYIQKLQEEERKIQAEISDLESAGTSSNSKIIGLDHQEETFYSNPKKIRTENLHDFGGSSSSPIEVLELRITNMGEKNVVISLTCSKRTDTIVKLHEMFESLNLKIITVNITAFTDRVLKTVFIEADTEEKDVLKKKIERAIAALNGPHSPNVTYSY